MRLPHFHILRRNSFLLFFFGTLSDSFSIKDQTPDQGDAEYNQYDTIDPVNDMNIMRRKPVTDLSGQEYFQNIRSKHPAKTGHKDDDALFYCMIDDRRGRGDPENENGRIQRVHQIA